MPAWFENLLRLFNTPFVVDYDDAVFHRYDLPPSASIRALLGRKIDRVMRHASMVIAGNRYIANRAKQAGAKRVEYLPSVVDVGRYRLKNSLKSSPLRIDWIGSPVTAPYLNQIKEALELFSREADIHLTLIGAAA